jgi:2-C-methyl-D-erythritol 4-phosphate cytidylyltransferase
MKVAALILAAGLSKRLAARERKPFITIAGRQIITYSLDVFSKIAAVDEIILAVNKKDTAKAEKISLKYKGFKDVRIVAGGKRRMDSVFNALLETAQDIDYVLIHDAARPLIKVSTVKKIIEEVTKKKAVICASKVTSTIKRSKRSNIVETTLDRSNLWQAQTPQAFKKSLLLKAYNEIDMSMDYTDDAQVLESLNTKVSILASDNLNIKITTPEDLLLAESILKKRKQ